MPIAKYSEGTQTVGWGMALESALIIGGKRRGLEGKWPREMGNASARLLDDSRPGLSNTDRSFDCWVYAKLSENPMCRITVSADREFFDGGPVTVGLAHQK